MCNITDHDCLQMEPGLTSLMATSRDYNELVAAWKGWRDATGKNMKDLYAEFVELRNEGARMSGRKFKKKCHQEEHDKRSHQNL